MNPLGTCTWKGCTAEAAHSMTGKDGTEWARLCDEHHAQFEAAMTDPRKALAAWASCQSPEARERLCNDIAVGVGAIVQFYQSPRRR